MLSFGLVFVFWSLATYGHWIDPYFLPSPTSIASTTYMLFSKYNLIGDIGISLSRVMIAFFISACLAIPIGILMSVFGFLEAFFEPLIDFIRYLPVPALVPLTLLWAGIGETSKILLLFIGTFFQLVLLVMDDTNNVRQEYIEAAYTLGAKTKDVLTRVIFPAIMPNVYDDLRVTLGWCWTYLVVAEIVASNQGIGHMIIESQRFNNPPAVISGVLIIGFIGIVSDYLFKVGGKVLFRYQQQ